MKNGVGAAVAEAGHGQIAKVECASVGQGIRCDLVDELGIACPRAGALIAMQDLTSVRGASRSSETALGQCRDQNGECQIQDEDHADRDGMDRPARLVLEVADDRGAR
jgi:hypothetical protein